MDVDGLPEAGVRAGALEGLRVLDIATMMAAPWTATYLADYGAEVVKVELPGKGDPVREWGSQVDGTSLVWKGLARNKRLITLALNRPEGQRMLLDLVDQFDVLIENFRPGVMERWGLGPEALHERHPGLIILRTTAYGQTGPYSHKPGFGTLAEAFSGLSHMTGDADGPPVLAGYPLADGVAALTGVMGVLSAVYWRDVRGGTGQVIDNSISEATYRLIDHVMLDYAVLGQVRTRAGNRLGDLAPRNTYRTRNGGWIAVSGGTQGIVESLFRAMRRPDLIDDPRFATNALRRKNVDALDELIAAWMATLDVDTVMARFEEHGVAGTAVNDAAQIAVHEHFRARQLLLRVDDPDLGPVPATHVHPRLSETPGGVSALGGAVGRDNAEFYAEALGLDDDDLARLRAAGVV